MKKREQKKQLSVFNALFAYRPREQRRPEEDFLTEALAYTVQACPKARAAWLKIFLGEEYGTRAVDELNIQTQRAVVEESGTTAGRPDIQVTGKVGDEDFVLYVEHKWAADCDGQQLMMYANGLERQKGLLFLGFVGANPIQVGEAKKAADWKSQRIKFRAIQWEEVYESFSGIAQPSSWLQQFMGFLEEQSLTPVGPITEQTLKALGEMKGSAAEQRASPAVTLLRRHMTKLRYNNNWDAIVRPFIPTPSVTGYGRVAMAFRAPKDGPVLTMGLLYKNGDHDVDFSDPTCGLDLMLRIEADPSIHVALKPLEDEVRGKGEALRQRGVSVELKGESGNRHTLLIAHVSLKEVLGYTSQQQTSWMGHELSDWCRELFGDRCVARAIGTDCERD